MSIGRLLMGLIILAIGVVLTLNNLGITRVSLGYLFFTYWPLILILIGLLTLFDTGRGRRTVRREDWTAGGRVEKTLGDLEIGSEQWELRDTDIQSGIGDVRLDLTKARIPPGETRVNISQWMGSVKVLIPRDLAVSARASASVGDVDLLGQRTGGFFREITYTSADYDQAETRVRFDINVGMGDARITRVG